MDNILKVENLKKTFPNSHFKLNNVSFSIRYGSIVGFIGENGAGKTTAMRTIVGALKKDGGSIKIFGKEINETDAKIKEDIGVVFDQINFSGNLNANELSKVMKNIYKQWNQEKYFEYLKRFSLPTKKKFRAFPEACQ
ncbi:ATP-binding cassette domain-containing protein [Aeribacillus sp. FSL K6-8394]|uniref:ATP-binding cassette domain-containing protein n=1 Tax=Aeribacillus sp. FSL K6-8394 TaxID=2954570 RepID=UPI0030FB476B